MISNIYLAHIYTKKINSQDRNKGQDSSWYFAKVIVLPIFSCIVNIDFRLDGGGGGGKCLSI